jgi:hypothetical protein
MRVEIYFPSNLSEPLHPLAVLDAPFLLLAVLFTVPIGWDSFKSRLPFAADLIGHLSYNLLI